MAATKAYPTIITDLMDAGFSISAVFPRISRYDVFVKDVCSEVGGHRLGTIVATKEWTDLIIYPTTKPSELESISKSYCRNIVRDEQQFHAVQRHLANLEKSQQQN